MADFVLHNGKVVALGQVIYIQDPILQDAPIEKVTYRGFAEDNDYIIVEGSDGKPREVPRRRTEIFLKEPS